MLPCRALLFHDPFRLLRITTPSGVTGSFGCVGETGEAVLAYEFVLELEEIEEKSLECARRILAELVTCRPLDVARRSA